MSEISCRATGLIGIYPRSPRHQDFFVYCSAERFKIIENLFPRGPAYPRINLNVIVGEAGSSMATGNVLYMQKYPSPDKTGS